MPVIVLLRVKIKMKKVELIYFVHGTTTDNELGLCTGWNPGELSPLGIRQSKELAGLIDVDSFDVVFCSDLKRAVDSAELVFENSNASIVLDWRLRECNYGGLNGASEEKRGPISAYIETPFPNGESYKDVELRMRSFVNFLLENYAGEKVAVVAHQAPQLALEVIVNKKTWEQVIKEDWRGKTPKAWRPGWVYLL